jgi:hypothetical protein
MKKQILAIFLVLLVGISVLIGGEILKVYTPRKFPTSTEPISASITGVLIKNPAYYKQRNGRGIETSCWDNEKASHLLVIDKAYGDIDNPPTYLSELWNKYPNAEMLKYKNLVPVFVEPAFSNLFGILIENQLDKYKNTSITLTGNLYVTRICDLKNLNKAGDCDGKIGSQCNLLEIQNIPSD